jgi:Arc/MetJ-type ribon-helix-helix transcriptional regulator
MTINLSHELESSILSLVQGGQFASIDEAMDEAARLLLRQQAPATKPVSKDAFHQHLLNVGLMSVLPDPSQDIDDDDDPPIEIEGEPLSETILRERR